MWRVCLDSLACKVTHKWRFTFRDHRCSPKWSTSSLHWLVHTRTSRKQKVQQDKLEGLYHHALIPQAKPRYVHCFLLSIWADYLSLAGQDVRHLWRFPMPIYCLIPMPRHAMFWDESWYRFLQSWLTLCCWEGEIDADVIGSHSVANRIMWWYTCLNHSSRFAVSFHVLFDFLMFFPVGSSPFDQQAVMASPVDF